MALTLPPTDILTGAIFGSALSAAGVFAPAVIISQMELTNFHMLKSFLAASAISALVVRIANSTSHASLPPRSPSAHSRIFRFDANIVGGLMLGTGMAVTGACPGTVLVQLAAGYPSARWVALGGLLGGLVRLEAAPTPELRSLGATRQAQAKDAQAELNQAKTSSKQRTTPSTTLLFAYETTCALALAAAAAYAPQGPSWTNPILGGLFIGGAQAASVLLSRKTVGVSTAYAQLVQYILSMVWPSKVKRPASLSAVAFAAGIWASAYVMVSLVPEMMSVQAGAQKGVGALTGMVGGAVMIVGARLAGGCTSGHGISGMATLGAASFVTVAAMFIGGIVSRAALDLV